MVNLASVPPFQEEDLITRPIKIRHRILIVDDRPEEPDRRRSRAAAARRDDRHCAVRRGSARAPARTGLLADAARRRDARHGRLRDRPPRPLARAHAARPDHLHHRPHEGERRTILRALRARRGRLPVQADLAGGAAREGASVHRAAGAHRGSSRDYRPARAASRAAARTEREPRRNADRGEAELARPTSSSPRPTAARTSSSRSSRTSCATRCAAADARSISIEPDAGQAGLAERMREIDRSPGRRRSARLVDDLLDVSRITSGKIELRREPLDLATIVDAAITTQPAAHRRRAATRCTVDCPRQPIPVHGDPMRLVQVIVEPAEQRRALHAAGRPRSTIACGIDGRARVRRGHATTASASRRSCCRRSSTCSCRSACAPTARAASASASRSPSASSSCTAARSRRRSGGRGCGSTFRVDAPARRTPTRCAPRTRTSDMEPLVLDASARTLRIVVVDDNADARELVAHCSRAPGHEVVVAAGRPERLATILSTGPTPR